MERWGDTLFFLMLTLGALIVCVSDLSVVMNTITAAIVKLGAGIAFIELVVATFTAFCRALS